MMEDRYFPDGSPEFDDFSGLSGQSQPSAASGLGSRTEFPLADATISPATLKLRGPAGPTSMEPRAMQVLVALADARGAVVTRDRLIEQCWGNVVVGDDSLNRAISGVRRALREAGSAAEIETVPKIGYRLDATFAAESDAVSAPAGWPRRKVLAGGGVAAVLALGAGGTWWLTRTQRDPRVTALIERGRTALRDQMPDGTQQGIAFFEEARRLAPEDAEVWGNLALAWRNVSEYSPLEEIPAAVAESENAARRALQLDPEQGEAHAALALLPPVYGDWLAAERRLREVHRRFPGQTAVTAELALLMFAVGRAPDAAVFSRDATARDPLSPIYAYRLTYHLWTIGETTAAEQNIDRALQLWPAHPAVWFARLLLFYGSDRYEQALRLLSSPLAEAVMGPDWAGLWRLSCNVLAGRAAAADRADAIDLNLAAAAQDGGSCISAIIQLSRMNALDEAFVVAEGYLLRRGPLVTDIGSRLASINDQRWRKTMMLFTPATAAMRGDSRFEQLCSDIGLAEYWRASGSSPYFRTRPGA